MSQPLESPDAARNLLLGVLALQMNFIDREALVAAVHAWAGDKAKPLGQLLLQQGRLTAGQLQALDALLVQYLRAHDGDARRSLGALATVPQLRSLLAPVADAEVRTTLADAGPATETDEAPEGIAAGNGASRYRVLRPHARGGLGEVFVAEDTELHREVALKEIQAEYADHPASRGRFVREAEITGGLEHPGIVPVYGLGAYPDGRPYYAMRFVRGHSLRDAVEAFYAADRPGRGPGERSLAFRHLLRRFIDVCNAVAYAHSRGVLHRDLKPANVMLGNFGETLVVDWGLAKAGVKARDQGDGSDDLTTDPALSPASDSDPSATREGSAMGTPAFMSPEQAAGRLDELSPATDIYSLGATLSVLLTGRTPFDGLERKDVLARVRLGQFPPPRQARPDTPPALDAVCRKATAPAPADRYASALDLAADVEHWLADEPVAAYPDPWAARLARWGRRHRTAVVAAGVFLVSAVVALSASTALVWRERQKTAAQKRVAVQNYELSRDLSFHIMDLIESSEAEFAAVPALHSTRKEILKATARGCRQYLEQEPNDTELRKRAAQVYRYTANVHRLTNEVSEAEPLYADSVRLYEGLAQQYPDDAVYRQKLAETLRDQASERSKAGRLPEATDLVGRSLEIAEKLRAEDPDRPTYRRALATALLNRSALERTRGMVAESGKTAGQSAELFRELLALPPGEAHPYDGVLLAAALNIVAISERESGRLDAARSAHIEAVKQLQGMVDKRPTGVNLADVLHFMASCRLEQCRTWVKTPERRANAEKNLGAAATQWEGLARDYRRVPMYRESLALAYQARGELRAEDRRADEARADFDKSRTLLEEYVKDYPDLPGARGELGRTYLGLGRLDRLAGNGAEAARWFGLAAEALGKAVEQSPDNARDRRSLEDVRAEQAR
jgi:serine/threonine-protein kinase